MEVGYTAPPYPQESNERAVYSWCCSRLAQRWRLDATDRSGVDLKTWKMSINLARFQVIASELPCWRSSSSPATSKLSKRLCLLHPRVLGISPERDWHVIYDAKLRADQEKRLGLPTPVEAILQHELIGHVLPVLLDPSLIGLVTADPELWEQHERHAIAAENRYRRHVGLPEVPSSLPHVLVP